MKKNIGNLALQRKSNQVDSIPLAKKPGGEISKNPSVVKARPKNTMIVDQTESKPLGTNLAFDIYSRNMVID